MTDRAMLTSLAVVADALVVGQVAHGWIDAPGVIMALAATFSAVLAWTWKERRR